MTVALPLTDEADDRTASGRSSRVLLVVLIYIGLTVAVVSTLGTPLIPTIALDQGVSLGTAQWLLTSTLLVGAVSTPVLGRLGDGPHRRRVLLFGLGGVTAGAVIAATAHNFPQLLIGRSIQGLGLGMMPLAIAVAREELRGQRLRSAVATLSVTVAVGAGLGYPITGLIADHADYHAAFWLAAVLATIGVVLVLAVVPGKSERESRPLDIPGAVFLGISLTALLIGLSEGERWGWGSPATLGLFTVAVVVFAGWWAYELHVEYPLIQLRFLAERPVMAANAAAILMGFGMYIGMSLINRYAQTPESTGYGFAASTALAGALLLPLSIGSLLSSGLARSMGQRVGMRAVIVFGALLVATTMAILAVSREHEIELALAMLVLGIGVGTTFAAMPTLIIRSVPAEETGSATSLNQVLRVVGGSMGSAVSAAVLTGHTPAGATYPTNNGYTVAFLISAAICLIAGIVTLLVLPKGVGQQTTPTLSPEAEELLDMEGADSAGAGLVPGDDPSVGIRSSSRR